MDQKDFLTQASGCIRARRGRRWWLRAVTAMAAAVVLATIYLLILPARTMEHGQWDVTPAALQAAPGQTIETELQAAADDGRGETFFALSADGDNAGLDDSQLAFDGDGVAVLTDRDGQTVELHRAYTAGGAAQYWFTLPEGQSAAFALPWVNGADRYSARVTEEQVPVTAGDPAEPGTLPEQATAETAAPETGPGYETVYHTETVLEQAGDRAKGGALTLTFGQGSSLDDALNQDGGTIRLTWQEDAGADVQQAPARLSANALLARPALLSEDEAGGDGSDGDGSDGSGNSSSHDFTNDITNVTVSKLENGQWKPSTEFTDGDSVQVVINYSIPTDVVGETNKTIHYQLPVGVTLAQDEGGTVYDGQKPVGTYTISQDGRITIEFNDDYADEKPFIGQIQFQGTVSSKEDGSDNNISFGAGGTITVKPNPEPTDVRADKSGSYNEQDGKLHYTIDITTTQGTKGAIKVTDSFQSSNTYVTYDTDSFKIVKLGSDGQEEVINDHTPVISTGGWDGAPQQFTITGLPALDAGESYRITYTATPGKTSNINGYSDVSNSVTTTTEGGSSSDWNQVVISQNMINKWGNYDSASGVINWTITINPDKRDIGGYTLTDTINADGVTAELPSTVTLTGSDGSSQTITLPYTFPDGSKDTYTITYQTKVEGLQEGQTSQVSNDAELTKGEENYGSGSSVWPQGVSLGAGKSFNGHDSGQDTGSTGTYQWNATITVPNSVSDEALGKLTFTDTIHDLVAADGSKAEGSHYITARQLEAMSVNINGVPLGRGTDYQICDANGVAITDFTGDRTYTGFQIQFTEAALKKIAGQTISLQYYTTVDYTKLTDGLSYTIRNTGGIPDHTNDAQTDYKRPGKLEKQASATGMGGSSGFTDGGLSIDYTASGGVIHYRLLVRTDASTTGDIKITDYLPDGATLKDDTVTMRIYNNAYSEHDYPVNWIDSEGENHSWTPSEKIQAKVSDDGQTVTFTIQDGYNGDGQIRTLAVYYDVSIAKDSAWTENPGLEVKDYVNTARWGDNKATTDVTVERDVPELKKTGEQLPQYDADGNPMKDKDGKELLSNTLRYTVTINPAAQDLDPNADVLQLVDTFGDLPGGVAGADLSIGSVKLYLYDADAADHLGSELSNARYSYTYDTDSRVLTFTIPDSMGLVLVYDYTIDRGTAAGSLTFSNAVELTGVAGSKTENQTHLEETSSSATTTKRTLTIYKVDGTNFGRTLQGAEFKLEQFVNNQWTQVGSTLTSDDNGQIVFDQVGDDGKPIYQLDTLYRLTETKAPSGYARDETPYYFVWLASGSTEKDMAQTITAAGASQDNVLFINDSSAIYVPNQPTTLTVQKVWTDEDGNETAPGAESVEVQLYRQAMISDACTVTITSQGNGGENPVTETIHVKNGTEITISFDGSDENMTVVVNGNSTTQHGTTTFHTGAITGNTNIVIYPTNGYWTYQFNVIHLNYTKPDEPTLGEKTPYGEAVTLNAGNNWSHTWGDEKNPLPRADNDGNPYYYTVEETKVPGYKVIYSSNNQNGIQTGQLVITNQASGYILPETGGPGTTLLATGGLALMALAGLLYTFLRRKGEEAP